MNPLVTVTIPLYNHEKYVKAAIESILNQSFQNFEIVIVDDCSTDNSVAIVEAIKDVRIHLSKNEFNGGPGFTCNNAIRKAASSSKFITLFTSDDLMKPNRLKQQVEFLQNNPGYGAVFSQVEMIDENGNVLKNKTKRYKDIFTAEENSREELLNRFFFKGNCLAAPTAMIRNDILQKFDQTLGYIFHPALYQAQDFDLFTRIALCGHNIKVLPEELISLRKRDNKKNLSADTTSVRGRLLFENEKIMSQYLKLDLNSFRKIFPDAKIPQNLDFNKSALAYLLAKEALKKPEYLYLTNLAINSLFEVLHDENNIKFLKKEFDFTIKDFSEIMAKYPLGVLSENTKKKSFFRKLFSF